MPTLRRILKYTPAVVLGLLVVAWVVSVFVPFGHSFAAAGNTERGVFAYRGSMLFFYQRESLLSAVACIRWDTLRDHAVAGECGHSYSRFEEFGIDYFRWRAKVPIAFAITAVLPLAIGPFISFRFRLWHYLAYTALIAIQLAYYLRWQE